MGKEGCQGKKQKPQNKAKSVDWGLWMSGVYWWGVKIGKMGQNRVMQMKWSRISCPEKRIKAEDIEKSRPT